MIITVTEISEKSPATTPLPRIDWTGLRGPTASIPVANSHHEKAKNPTETLPVMSNRLPSINNKRENHWM